MRKVLLKIAAGNRGTAINELIGIAAACIVAAFIVIPQLRSFSITVMDTLAAWWGEISGKIFETS